MTALKVIGGVLIGLVVLVAVGILALFIYLEKKSAE
jgi:hypothetical protein